MLASLVFLATFNILFIPSSTADHHVCTAYSRYQVPAHPDVALDENNRLIILGPTVTKTSWASTTCTVIGPFQSNTGTYYAEITNADLDPNLPGVEVIACIAGADVYGGLSTCINAQNLTPNSITNPLAGGATSAPTANASDQ